MEARIMGAETARVLHGGPLRRWIDGFIEFLCSQGYEAVSVRSKLAIAAQISRWLERSGRALDALAPRRIREFLRARRRSYRGHAWAAATAFQLSRYLQRAGAVSGPQAVARHDRTAQLEAAYREYLGRERGLARVTIDNYVALIRPFLAGRYSLERLPLARRGAGEVTRFVVRQTRGMCPGRAKLLATALRSLLRFLHVTGRTARDLGGSVPRVADWRHTAVPKFIAAEDVRRLLRACDRRTPGGRRDHAVLLLLARLGLRAGEVVRLTLDDIDWDAGQLRVRGKGSRCDRLPLPRDVGEALVEYLRRDRLPSASRRLFLCARAPRRGFSSSVAVCTIVRRAIERAGLRTPTKGAHLLRHSLATDLLRRGASLAEIGELLRHRSPDTTMLYAKVDFRSLREIAPPWPGGAR